MRICQYSSCQNKHDSHGYCANHVRQVKKYGHVLTVEEISAKRRDQQKKSSGSTGKNWNIKDTSKMKGHHPHSEFKKGIEPWDKGKTYDALLGEKHFAWKGDSVGYTALHSWVKRKLGKPGTCQRCGKSGLKNAQVHWANISHEYKRDLADWARLCAKCHKAYDIKGEPLWAV